MWDDFINSLDDSLDTKSLAMLRWIVMPSSNIPNPGDNTSGFEENRDFLGKWQQG